VHEEDFVHNYNYDVLMATELGWKAGTIMAVKGQFGSIFFVPLESYQDQELADEKVVQEYLEYYKRKLRCLRN